MKRIPHLVLVVVVTAFGLKAATTDKLVQWPLPVPNGPTFAFQERKAMLPEMAAHHTEMIAKVLNAVAKSDRAAYLFRGASHFQKADPKNFDLLVSTWAERLKGGIRVSSVGELQRSDATSLWRVQFTAGGDDALVVLSTDKRGNIVSLQFL